MSGEQDRVDEVAGAVVARFRQRVIRELGKSEAVIDEAFTEMAPRVRQRLKAIGHSPEQVEQILREEWESHLERRAASIGESITAAHREGAAAEPSIFERVFGEDTDADPFGHSSGSHPSGKQ